MHRTRLLCGLLVLGLAAGVLAQDAVKDPNNARGFDPGKMYSFSDVDAVNTFNGNLTLRIPIGQTYSVGPGLSYQFMLTYNSKIWDYLFVEYDDTSGRSPYQRRAVPELDSNAGLGWTLSLGRVAKPRQETPTTPARNWTYIAPDGSQHIIGEDEEYTSMAVRYTVDGSFIRVTHAANTDVYNDKAHVLEFPSGSIHYFDTEGLLTRIEDRFGNWVKVAYGTTATGAEMWTITDGQRTSAAAVRTHTVEFAKAPADKSYPDNPNFLQRVAKISLSAFPASQDDRAVYTFEYADTEIERGGCGSYLEVFGHRAKVALLEKIKLPDGTFYDPSYTLVDVPSCASGTITQLTLPTLGTIGWKHGAYELPATDCFIEPVASEGRDIWSYFHVGVTERTFNAPGAPEMKWTYSPKLHPHPAGRGDDVRCGKRIEDNWPLPPHEFTNTVTTPSGQTVVHHFSAFNVASRVSGNYGGPNVAMDYGLPFTRSGADGDAFLSQTISDESGVVQKVYVRYDRDIPDDGVLPAMPSSVAPAWQNRPAAERRRYLQDAGCGSGNEVCHVVSASSDFDNYGHYRTVVRSSNFGPTKTTYTDYNLTGGVQRVIGTGEPWILGHYSKQTATDSGDGAFGASSRTALVCIDPATGLLKGQRTLKGSAAGEYDVLVRYTHNTSGFITAEDWYGGDISKVQSSNLCTKVGAGTSEYQINYRYEHGIPARAWYTGMTHYQFDNTIDANTGLVSASRDSAGLETTYAYDAMGRLTHLIAPSGLITQYQYTAAKWLDSTFVPARVTVQRGPESMAGSTTSSFEFDGLGRVRATGQLQPSDLWSYRYNTYDAAGRLASETELGKLAEASLPKTTFHYDAFDRQVLVQRPDGSKSTSAFEGQGIRKRTDKSMVEMPGGAAAVTKTQILDAYGRLVQVLEHSGPTTHTAAQGDAVTTQYSYDVADQLRIVRMSGPDGVQNRTFEYDGRGLLTSEKQPESSAMSYTYDSRGKVRTQRVGAAGSLYDLEYQYDAAERLIEVSGRNPGYDPNGQSPVPFTNRAFRPVKTFDYATTNDTGRDTNPTDYGKGKLRIAARYNYGASPTDEIVKVVEKTYYHDADGRPTHKMTEVWSNKFVVGQFMKMSDVEMSQTYNIFGELALTYFPQCMLCSSGPSRSTRYEYTRGRLLSVKPGGLNSPPIALFSYHPNGMLDTTQHLNGMVDKQELHPTIPMARPYKIYSSPPVICTPPSISQQPTGASIRSGASVTLSVVAAGSAPISYQWYRVATGNDVPIADATGASLTVSPAETTKYYVEVKNGCKPAKSLTVVVSVESCPAPEVAPERRINGDGTMTLSAFPSGAGVLTCKWYRVADDALVGTGAVLVVDYATGTEALEVRATSDACPGTGTGSLPAIVQVLHTVTDLRADVSTDRKAVTVRWRPFSGGGLYVLSRRAASGATTFAVDGTTGVFEDRTIEAGKAYAYTFAGQVRGNVDVATTLAFSAVVPRVSIIEPRYFDEILSAINAIRAIPGDSALTWRAILPPALPVPARGVMVYTAYLDALRTRMDDALSVVGDDRGPYTDPIASGKLIQAVYVIELQRRAQ